MPPHEAASQWPPQFGLDQERVLELLTGDRFYGDASAALREAVLNAIDAVHRRGSEEPDHEGLIRVEFDVQELTLRIEDNGDGMSRDDIQTLFVTVGASASTSDPHGKNSIGEFGIGVISYFLAADSFVVDTLDGSDGPVALRFRREMFAGGPAEALNSTRTSRGTAVTLQLRDREVFDVLLDAFPYWIRGVAGLEAVLLPSGDTVPQHQVGSTYGSPSTFDTPEGLESTTIGPITTQTGWEVMTGSSTVSILYRGVYVQEYEVQHLWGMQGSISVDPKHFKPRLNREGFVGDDFRAEIDGFLRAIHPDVLVGLVETLERAVGGDLLDDWSARRWATLWLSVPRSGDYEETAARWDTVFRRIPAFEKARGNQWIPASVDSLAGIDGPIYVTPHKEEKQNDVIKSASRLLRETGAVVVRGLERERNWLVGANNSFATTADLVANRFADELPELRHIANEAETILAQVVSLHILFSGEVPVELAQLGEAGPPVLKLKRRLLINTDSEQGCKFVLRVLDLNGGRGSLLVAAPEFLGPSYVQQVASVGTVSPNDPEVLGLVKRRYIRKLLS